MLQIVFVAILVGIALIQIPSKKSKVFLDFFDGLNEVVLKVIDIIMLMAPIGVFSLIAQTINKVVGNNLNQVIELLGALGFYMFTLTLGLILHVVITYLSLLKFYTKMPIQTFFKGISPAQLLAFSTSSSGATLPITCLLYTSPSPRD